jgi:hypothetical protein
MCIWSILNITILILKYEAMGVFVAKQNSMTRCLRREMFYRWNPEKKTYLEVFKKL